MGVKIVMKFYNSDKVEVHGLRKGEWGEGPGLKWSENFTIPRNSNERLAVFFSFSYSKVSFLLE